MGEWVDELPFQACPAACQGLYPTALKVSATPGLKSEWISEVPQLPFRCLFHSRGLPFQEPFVLFLPRLPWCGVKRFHELSLYSLAVRPVSPPEDTQALGSPPTALHPQCSAHRHELFMLENQTHMGT